MLLVVYTQHVEFRREFHVKIVLLVACTSWMVAGRLSSFLLAVLGRMKSLVEYIKGQVGHKKLLYCEGGHMKAQEGHMMLLEVHMLIPEDHRLISEDHRVEVYLFWDRILDYQGYMLTLEKYIQV